jgi:hypothetical protein
VAPDRFCYARPSAGLAGGAWNGFAKEDETMLGLAKAERSVSRLKDLDIADLQDQLDTLRDYMHELTATVGRGATRHFGRARDFASEAAQEAEEAMKDNLAASLVLAVGLGIVVGYFIRRGTE